MDLPPLYRRKNRPTHLIMTDINKELIDIHKSIMPEVHLVKYTAASQCVSEYISYTDVWNIKFTYNFESPEVALMQILHLDFIFEHEPGDLFVEERKSFQEVKQLLLENSPYSTALIEKRKNRLYDYVKTNTPNID